MGNDMDLVRRVKQEMLDTYKGVHNGVAISSIASVRSLYDQGSYQLGRDALPAQEDGPCVVVGLLEEPSENFEYVTELDGVHIFYFVRGMPRKLGD